MDRSLVGATCYRGTASIKVLYPRSVQILRHSTILAYRKTGGNSNSLVWLVMLSAIVVPAGSKETSGVWQEYIRVYCTF
jgi:hypothetical protein